MILSRDLFNGAFERPDIALTTKFGDKTAALFFSARAMPAATASRSSIQCSAAFENTSSNSFSYDRAAASASTNRNFG